MHIKNKELFTPKTIQMFSSFITRRTAVGNQPRGWRKFFSSPRLLSLACFAFYLVGCSSGGGGGGTPAPPPIYLWVSDQRSDEGNLATAASGVTTTMEPARRNGLHAHYCSQTRATALGIPAAYTNHRMFLGYGPGDGADISPLNFDIPNRDNRPLHALKAGTESFADRSPRIFDKYLDIADLTKTIPSALPDLRSLLGLNTMGSDVFVFIGLLVDGNRLIHLPTSSSAISRSYCDDNSDIFAYNPPPWRSTGGSGIFIVMGGARNFMGTSYTPCANGNRPVLCVSY